MKIALLSSYTADLLPDQVNPHLKANGLEAEWYVAPFNQYRQEILNTDSGLARFNPDIIFLCLDAAAYLPDFKGLCDFLIKASDCYRSATLFVHNGTLMEPEPLQLLTWNTGYSDRLRLAGYNVRLCDELSQAPNVKILDLERLLLRYGTERMCDARLRYLAKIPFSQFGLQKVGEQMAVAVAAVSGKRKKCLVLDLDNTLWGGILGEDGIEHIQLSNEGEGRAFYDFQKVILRLSETGVLLALCSKNDQAPALDVLAKHPAMLLRPDTFAAWRINWENKADNLKSLAQELDIGLDSMVFLDDSPHERALIRQSLPEVLVPDLPEDPSEYASFLAELSCFETFTVTEADRTRGAAYYQERQRSEAKASVSSLEDYLKDLNTRIVVETAYVMTIPRIAQLTQRTNQFNLTTRRYTEAQVRARAKDAHWRVLSVSAQDRFGDAGIVGAAFIEIQGTVARLDTFLMSCRVLGRQIEEAFLAECLQLARKEGARTMKAAYLPTAKNGMAKDFLPQNNFQPKGAEYVRDLGEPIEPPKWIRITHAET